MRRWILLTTAALALAPTPPAQGQPAPAEAAPAADLAADATSEVPGDWLNIQGVGWDGGNDPAGAEALLRLSLGMGYRYAYHGEQHDAYDGPYRRDLFFYYNDPHKHVQPSVTADLPDDRIDAARAVAPYSLARHPMLPRAIDEAELRALRDRFPDVFDAYREAFEATKSWCDATATFPANLAQLQVWGDADDNRWEPCPDVQRSAVIDRHVAAIVAHVRAQERPDRGYRFKGVVIDVPDLWNEFNWASRRPLPGSPDEARSAVPRDGVTYDYATLQEGWYHFLFRLRAALVAEFPGRGVKMIYEPADLWADWGRHVAAIPHASVTPDMMPAIRGDALVGEKPTIDFLADGRLAADGWPLSRLGSVTGDLFPKSPSYAMQLVVLGEAAARGSHFFAYGTFARDFARLPHTYAPDLLLIRIVAGWENGHATPLEARRWDYARRVYLSPTAVADESALAAVDPHTGGVAGVLRTPGATVRLADGVAVASATGVNEYFEPTDGEPPVTVEGGVVSARPGASYPVAFRLTLEGRPGVVFSHADADQIVRAPQERPVVVRDLYNGDFEAGPDGWFTGDGGAVRVVPSTDVVHGGRSAGRLVGRTKRWHGFSQRVTDALNVRGPGTYRVGAFARPTSSATTVTARLEVESAGGSTVYESPPVAAAPGAWTEVSASFDVALDAPASSATLSFRVDDPTQPFHLDDATLERVAPPPAD